MKACIKLWSAMAMVLAVLVPSLWANFVYVANFGDNTISAYRIGESGALTPVTGSPFPALGPFSVAADPFGRFLYVANTNFNTVSAYRIGEKGTLTPVAGSPFPAGFGPFSVTVDPLGRFVYVPNLGSGNVSGYRIGKNGAFKPIEGSPFQAGLNPATWRWTSWGPLWRGGGVAGVSAASDWRSWSSDPAAARCRQATTLYVTRQS